MEEIIDIDELAEKQQNEKIKEYLKEDESVSKELTDKINELTIEKNKLSDKSAELKEKEDSLRDKLTHDANTDDIRKIADEIDEIKQDMIQISENISGLEKDLKEISNAKNRTEETKVEYSKKISSTIDEYDKKISTIEAAIKVCDNEYLKKAQEEELSKMKETLDDMKEERSRELKEALNVAMPNNTDDSYNDLDSNSDTKINSLLDEVTVSPLDINNDTEIEIPSVIEDKTEPEETHANDLDNIIPLDLNLDFMNSNEEEKENDTNILTEDITPTVDLSLDLDINNTDASSYEVINEDTVSDDKISEIFSSSGILPSVFEYLDKMIKEGV